MPEWYAGGDFRRYGSAFGLKLKDLPFFVDQMNRAGAAIEYLIEPRDDQIEDLVHVETGRELVGNQIQGRHFGKAFFGLAMQPRVFNRDAGGSREHAEQFFVCFREWAAIAAIHQFDRTNRAVLDLDWRGYD